MNQEQEKPKPQPKVRHFPEFRQGKSLAQEIAEFLAKEEKLKKDIDKK